MPKPQRLSEYVDKFEVLHYDTEPVHKVRERERERKKKLHFEIFHAKHAVSRINIKKKKMYVPFLPLLQAHQRHRRSAPDYEDPDLDLDFDSPGSPPVRLDFFSHGRRFQLELVRKREREKQSVFPHYIFKFMFVSAAQVRDHSVFHNDLSVVGGDDVALSSPSASDTSHIYEGRVLGE